MKPSSLGCPRAPGAQPDTGVLVRRLMWPQRLTNEEQGSLRERPHTEREGAPPLDRVRARRAEVGRRPHGSSLHRHRLCRFPFFLCKNLGCFRRFLKPNASKEGPAATPPCGPEGGHGAPPRGGPAASLRGWTLVAAAERDGKGCLLFRVKASGSTPHIHGQAGWTADCQAWRGSASGPAGGRPRGWMPAPQALLSSTFTARGLMAPVRFIWEAAPGASCRVTAPRPGFSSTRGFAFGQRNGTKRLPPHSSRRRLHSPPACA